jgi:hypothetical protein
MNKPQAKSFNTTGVCVPSKHYILPVLPRIPDVTDMITGEFYFILHAPRQSGKTTFLQALTDKINTDGQYYALYCSLEVSQGVLDVETAMRQIVVEINRTLKKSPIRSFKELSVPGVPLVDLDASEKVAEMLNYLSFKLDKDLVVFFDESDCLSGSPLITFLRQIRLGYNNRTISPESKFPRSMALVGMRDIRDYLVQVRPEEKSASLASPFNVKKKSLTLANFTQDEIRYLYNQHTEATGQIFDRRAIERAWYWSEGQPWLVNAIADHIVVEQVKGNYYVAITGEQVDLAAETLIKLRQTHIDSLLARLQEPGVRRVMEAVIKGDPIFPSSVSDDDVEYALDLGLLKKEKGSYLPSNPIYQEVILRTLTQRIQESELLSSYENRWMDGKTIDMTSLLKSFQGFWRENSGILPDPNGYVESTAHLIFFAYLQRVLNGGAEFIKREYALGMNRVDVCVGYRGHSYPLELKIKGHKSLADSLEQVRKYIDISGALEGWLIIFDRSNNKSWDKKIYWETKQVGKMTIHVVGC